MTLPYVVDAQTSLSPAELQVLHDQYDTEAAAGHITTQTKFNYAWALIKSQDRQQMLQGVALLTGTPTRTPLTSDIYRTDPPRRRECLYYLSLGHYKLSNFDEAKRFNSTCTCSHPGLLLEREPNNLQAPSLNALIEKGIARGTCTPLTHRGIHRHGPPRRRSHRRGRPRHIAPPEGP